MKKLLFTLLLMKFAHFAAAQTVLSEGQIAFLSIQTDAPDRFAFVLLTDVENGTSITFTDNTWLNGTALATNEETATWTANADLSLGTVITITDPGSGTSSTVTGGGTCSGRLSGLAADGDQILAYQGASSSPSFIAAISSENFSATCNTTTGGSNNNTSCLPSPLSVGVNAVALTNSTTEIDNGYFSSNINFNGSVESFLGIVNNSSNWTTSNTAQTWPSWSFVIPVVLTSFTVKATPVPFLEWQTATERNNSHFEIERSTDGATFEKIGEVAGKGNSTGLTNYNFEDKAPLSGVNYYRLRQVDFDGAFEYSAVRSVVFGSTKKVTVFPAPVASVMTVQLDEAFKNDAQWQITDMAGRLVAEGIFAAEQNQMNIPVNGLVEGVYVLRIVAGQETITRQFRKI